MSPPERESRPVVDRAASSPCDSRKGNAYPSDLSRQLRVRRAASWRLPGGDPWGHREPVGERGYPQAALHLLMAGLIPAPNWPALKSMWKSSSESRRAAQIVAERWAA